MLALPGGPGHSRSLMGRPATSPRTSGSTVGVSSYRADALYPRIARAVAAILQREKVVSPVDVLVGMGLLTQEHLDDWRRGRAPYLERVIDGT